MKPTKEQRIEGLADWRDDLERERDRLAILLDEARGLLEWWLSNHLPCYSATGCDLCEDTRAFLGGFGRVVQPAKVGKVRCDICGEYLPGHASGITDLCACPKEHMRE